MTLQGCKNGINNSYFFRRAENIYGKQYLKQDQSNPLRSRKAFVIFSAKYKTSHQFVLPSLFLPTFSVRQSCLRSCLVF